MLWCIYIADLMTQLADKISWDFLIQCITAYADDFCHHQSFDSLLAFEAVLRNAGTLMDTLEENGVKLNTIKTVAICKFIGTQIAQLSKKHILRTRDGTFIKIPHQNGS